MLRNSIRKYLIHCSFFRLMSTESQKHPPLAGIKILDLTRFVAGPLCTMILGDLGADVYKIEEITKGDIIRTLPPFVNNTDVSCQFISVNRSKRSICVDIRSTEGQNLLRDLAQKCDVLVENFIPGTLDKYKLGYEQLKTIAPQLIYCSITGFGYRGLYSNKPGVDLIAASVGGFLHITGPEDGDPCRAGVAVTDMMTGLYAHGAIMAALLNRLKTGMGDQIDCNLFSTQVASLTNVGMNYLNANIEAKRLGTAHGGVVPYETFKTKDGYITAGAMRDEQFKELCLKMSLPDLYLDNRFITNVLRVKNRKELLLILKSKFRSKTTADWCLEFENCSFPFGPVNTLAQVFEDPHVKEIRIVKEVNHPEAGVIKLLDSAVQFTNSINGIQSPPPTLGQHTKEVLQNILHYSDKTINKLIDNKIIR